MSQSAQDESLLKSLTYSYVNRLELFKQVESADQGFILLKLSEKIQKDILKKLADDEIITLLNFLDPDKATDILQLLPKTRANEITAKLNDTIKEKVELLLKFSPQAAAGIMNLNYIIVSHTATFGEIQFELEDYENRTGKFPTILVIDQKALIGELPGHILATHKGNEQIEKYINKVPAIRYDSEERKVVTSFIRNPHSKIVVLNDDESVLGVIHSDDILKLIDKRSMRDLYNFAGVKEEEDALDGTWTKVKFRYKWLIINLGTAFLAAYVVGLFDETISKFTILAAYMPIVAGMGGNAATQTLAVTIRGIVMKEIDLKTSAPVIWNEMMAGAVNGVINGIIVAIIAIVFNQSWKLGIVISSAMVVNLIVAGFFGTLIPLIMKKLGKDPAASATIFITTATDVIGFLFFLGLAKALL